MCIRLDWFDNQIRHRITHVWKDISLGANHAPIKKGGAQRSQIFGVLPSFIRFVFERPNSEH